jgi:hypothetical protein
MRKESLLSIGAPALALLGAQHHNLMLLLVIGLGGTGMSVMTEAPLVRAAMLSVSLAMVGVVGYQISKSNRPLAMRVTGAISIAFTLGLAGWSILQFGL